MMTKTKACSSHHHAGSESHPPKYSDSVFSYLFSIWIFHDFRYYLFDSDDPKRFQILISPHWAIHQYDLVGVPLIWTQDLVHASGSPDIHKHGRSDTTMLFFKLCLMPRPSLVGL